MEFVRSHLIKNDKQKKEKKLTFLNHLLAVTFIHVINATVQIPCKSENTEGTIQNSQPGNFSFINMNEKYISYIFHVFSEARDHILILNILFFNKLRQIIPEVRSEMRDLLIFIFILKTTGTFCLFDLCTLFTYIPCTCLQPLGVKFRINKVS
jgi:hypothetical protein